LKTAVTLRTVTLGDLAIERACAELRAVQEAAVRLAYLMARFGQDAEELVALLQDLEGSPRAL
jgi:hypothetical protein